MNDVALRINSTSTATIKAQSAQVVARCQAAIKLATGYIGQAIEATGYRLCIVCVNERLEMGRETEPEMRWRI